jgi:hypothetical protein
MIHAQTKKYEWDALEYDHVEKTTDWYWALGIIVVVGIILCIISKNYLLAILLFLGGIMLGYYGNEKPKRAHVELSDRGMKIDNDLYLYETMGNFWMYTDPKGRNCLTVITGRKVMPRTTVTIPDSVSGAEIRAYLMRFLEEKELKPSIIELIAESVGL